MSASDRRDSRLAHTVIELRQRLAVVGRYSG